MSTTSKSPALAASSIALGENEWLLSDAKPGDERFNFGLTKEPFVTVNQLREIRDVRDNTRTGTLVYTYTFKDSKGIPQFRSLPDMEDDDGQKLRYAIGYRNLFHVSTDFCALEYEEVEDWDGQFSVDPLFIRSANVFAGAPLSHLNHLEHLIKTWDERWHSSKAKTDLTQHLEACNGKMRRVDKVIGIGLGRIEWNDPAECGERADVDSDNPYIQHLTLQHVAKELSRLQGTNVKMIVQDPAYDDVTKIIFDRSLFDFKIVEDPEAFYEMDNNTMVLYFYLPFDAAAVALAVAGDGGLAGMMCTPIDADHETMLRGKKLNAPMRYDQVTRLHSSAKWKWAQKCAVQQIAEENQWYGGVDLYLRLKDE